MARLVKVSFLERISLQLSMVLCFANQYVPKVYMWSRYTCLSIPLCISTLQMLIAHPQISWMYYCKKILVMSMDFHAIAFGENIN
jgi:hypothetical protein